MTTTTRRDYLGSMTAQRVHLGTQRRISTAVALVVALVSVLGGILTGSSPVSAEVDEVVKSGQVGQPTPSRSLPWMVSAWDFAQIGDVVYVGGQFTEVRRWAGDDWVNQPYLAAFDAETGRPIADFSPQLNGTVFALETSSDGSQLFVGGEFTEVNGQSRVGLVALDPTTGDTIASFGTTIAGTKIPAVNDLERVGSQLYVGGSFTTVRTSQQGSVSRWRVARLFEKSGTADSFRPTAVNGRVFDIEVSPDGERVYLGGAFSAVNNTPDTTYFAAVSSKGVGKLLPDFAHGIDRTNLPATGQAAYVFGIAATNDHVWIGTESHFLQQLDADDGERQRAYLSTWWNNKFRGGDFQALLIVGDRLYVGGHAYGMMVDLQDDSRCLGKAFLACRDSFPQSEWIDIRGTWVNAFDVNSGNHLSSFRPRTAGRSGVWALHWDAARDTLWFGGDITHNNFDAARGFARLTSTDAPTAPDAVSVRTTRQTKERIVLNWTRSNGDVPAAHYEIERDGAVVATDNDNWHTDLKLSSGTTFTYRVRGVSADGVTGPWSAPLQASTQA